MRFLRLLLFLLPIGFASAQTTNQCPLSGSASSTAASTSLDNRLRGCYNWRFTYTSTGFSALSIQVEGSPDNSTWTALAVVTGDGSNPSTTITYATSGFHINPSFIRVNLTAATGSGLVNWQLTGTAGAAPTSTLAQSGGGGGGGVVTQSWTVGVGGVTAGQLVCVSRTANPATAITCTTTGVISNAQIDATIIGIAQGTVSAGGTVQVIVQGPATCTFDAINPVVAGHTANYSLSVNGDCQDSGATSTNFGIPFVGVATTSGTGLQSIWVMGPGLFGSRNHPIAPLRTTNPGGLFPEDFQLQIANTTQTMLTNLGFANGTSLPLATGTFTVGDCVTVDSVTRSLIDAGAPCGTGTVTSVGATAPLTSTGGATPVISATYQGNGAKVQASTGATTTNNCVKFDANGNTVDAGAPCGTGTGGVTAVAATAPLTSSGGTTPVISATYQGNGAKVQASTGSTTTGHCVQFDANGNTVDSGAACGGGGSSITIGQGIIASKPTCTNVLNEIYYPTDSYYPQLNCLTGATSWTYLLEGKQFFPPAACASWTVVNGSSGTAACTNTKDAITLSTTSQVDGIEAAVKAVKTAPYTETIAVRVQAYESVGALAFAQIACGPIWSTTAATSGANTYAGVFQGVSSGNTPSQWAVIASNNTSFAYAGNASVTKFGLNTMGGPMTLWFQFIDDNTNRTINISADGINYVAAYGPTARTSPFTPGFVGFGCMPNHSTAGIPWSITLLSDN